MYTYTYAHMFIDVYNIFNQINQFSKIINSTEIAKRIIFSVLFMFIQSSIHYIILGIFL